MPTYRYRAKNTSGHTVTGTLEADNERAAASLLRTQGLWPMAIEASLGSREPAAPAARPAPPVGSGVQVAVAGGWQAPAVPPQRLMVYFRQLAAAVHSGMPLGRSLELMRQQSRGTLARFSFEAAEAVHQGQPLSSVLERHPRAFSRLIVALVRAGEVGGMLDVCLNRIADMLERQYALQQAIRRDTFFPKLTLGFGALIALATRLIIGAIGGPGAAIGSSFGNVLVPVLGCGLLVYIGVVAVGRLGLRGRAVDQAKLMLPVVGRVVRQLAVTRFLRALASLYRAGVAVPEALAVAAEASGNVAIEERLLVALPAVQRGERLSVALAPARLLPDMAAHMLASGEETGNVDEMLDKAAEYAEAETEGAIKAMATLVGPTVLVLVGILVGIEVIRFFTGYANQVLGTLSGE